MPGEAQGGGVRAPGSATVRRGALLGTRRRRIALIGALVVAFIVLSGLLAGFLSVEGVERDDLLTLLRAQARGDAPAMLARLDPRCARNAKCLATIRSDAATLRRPGAVKILTLTSKTAYALDGASGPSRVAWTVIGRLPVVQCVQVRRSGNPLTGITVKLLSLSPPISGEGECPGQDESGEGL